MSATNASGGQQSKLPLKERLQGCKIKRPVEIASWSQNKLNEIFFDDRALSYYYFKNEILDQHTIDLSKGFNPKEFSNSTATYLDNLLTGIIHEEKKTQQKLPVDIITWRGILTMLLKLSQGQTNPDLVSEEIDLLVTKFDGQIFISQSDSMAVASKAFIDSKPFIKKFMYSGFQFEHVATLPKPWGECSRAEIENRYTTPQPTDPKLNSEYCILIKGGIGDIALAYGCETDCVIGDKNMSDKLANYLELKTSKVIYNSKDAQNFEKKLLNTWIQSFLAGVPRVAYGFRDSQLHLKAVETYEVAQLPVLVKKSKQLPATSKWDGHDVMQFYSIVTQWLKDKVQDNCTYSLKFTPNTSHLVLKPDEVNIGRKHAFLSDEFVNWRNSLH